MPARTPRRRANPSGVHHLNSPSVLRAIVRSAGLDPADRVFDLGAGPGTLTAALARTGASVTAVERDPAFVRELERRFAGFDRVRVVSGDLRAVPIPRGARVVANLPFATSGALVARLLDPPGPQRAGIDLLVEHGFALRLSARHPRSARSAWWAARYELRLVRVVPRTAFAPAPGVDAALLRIRPREPLDRNAEQRLRALLAAAHRAPHARAYAVARRHAGRHAGPAILRAAGVHPGAAAVHVAPRTWAAVARGPGSRAARGTPV
jgi:23S rRNA (adenine-N6)-dimethyltransferase